MQTLLQKKVESRNPKEKLYNKEQGRHPDLSVLLKELPPWVSRAHPRFRELTGYSARTIANLDCLGQGPRKRIMLGNTVAYERAALIAWLESRSRMLP